MDKIVLEERKLESFGRQLKELISLGQVLVNGSKNVCVRTNEDGAIDLVPNPVKEDEQREWDPELPSKKSASYIEIPYRGYIVPKDLPKTAQISFKDRKKFKDACIQYYTDCGCDIFIANCYESYVYLTMIRRDFSKTPQKSVLDYMDKLND